MFCGILENERFERLEQLERFECSLTSPEERRLAEQRSKVPGLGGWGRPIIITSIKIANRRIGKFFGVHVIEATELDRIEIAANGIDVPAPERPHAAMSAKQVMHAVTPELIISQVAFAVEQAEGVRFENYSPGPYLGAH
jgi:hypothetical protein